MGGAPPFEDGACSPTTRSDGDPHSELLDRVSGLLNGPRRLVARTATKSALCAYQGWIPVDWEAPGTGPASGIARPVRERRNCLKIVVSPVRFRPSPLGGCAAAPACVLGRSRQSTRRFLRPWQAGVLAGK
jgi:hypothetical protein